jgi:hypothetical protein
MLGASLYCRFFDHQSTFGAESFSYDQSMAWIDSTKKIRRKTSGGNVLSAILSVERQHGFFFAMAKKTLDIF